MKTCRACFKHFIDDAYNKMTMNQIKLLIYNNSNTFLTSNYCLVVLCGQPCVPNGAVGGLIVYNLNIL